MIDKEKYLLPYVMHCWFEIRRYSIANNRDGIVFVRRENNAYNIFLFTRNKSTVSYTEGNILTRSKAKEKADKILIDEGYILIPKDKVEQYKVLI
jgi:hypothetical protein